MSSTPIFDATLADAPRNIWQASPIFPRPPAKAVNVSIAHMEGTVPFTYIDPADWSTIKLGGDA